MRFTDLTPEAIEQVLQEWAPASSRAGILALLPEAEKDRIPLLQAAAERHSMALAGAVFPALLRGDDFVNSGAWLLCFDTMPQHFLLPDINAGAGKAADRVVAAVRRELGNSPPLAEKPTLFMIFDGMVPNIARTGDEEGSVHLLTFTETPAEWRDPALAEVCRRARAAGPQDSARARAFLEENFRPERLVGEGVLTAYFSPEYEARERPSVCSSVRKPLAALSLLAPV